MAVKNVGRWVEFREIYHTLKKPNYNIVLFISIWHRLIEFSDARAT